MSVTTPRQTTMSAHSPTKTTTPSRRVLGDLTPRAINTPARHAEDVMLRAQSPLKQTQMLPPQLSYNKENAPTASLSGTKIGRKRSIEEVDGVEHGTHAPRLFGAGISTGEISGYEHSHDQDRDDRGSSTEPDTPPESPKQSQESNPSFSNFVDWKNCASSQTHPSSSQSKPSSQTQQPVSEIQAPRQPTKADLLRLRLGFATYRVKTNQIEKPVSEILGNFETQATTISTSTSTSTSTSLAHSNANIPSITLSHPAPSTNEAMHIKANLDPFLPTAKLSLGGIGGPILRPTAFAPSEVRKRDIHGYDVRSSPPPELPECVSPAQLSSPHRVERVERAEYQTPAARRIYEENYSDSDAEEEKDEEEEQEPWAQYADGKEEAEDSDVASTVDSRDSGMRSVGRRAERAKAQKLELERLERERARSPDKGNAAKGLLELMSGRR